ncbi:MAG: DHH family phosphoesterase [Methanomicrobiales archaeon]|nr:DHH family phosphoesterase [Methanomicrobiales archaeon]
MPEPISESPNQMIRYAIFGCGSTGYNILEELLKDTSEILIFDRDKKRVEDLRVQKYNAMVRDLKNPELLTDVPPFSIALVLANDKDANIAAVRTIRQMQREAYIIARAVDPVSIKLLEDAGADLVVYPQQVVAQEVIEYVRKFQSARKARELYELLAAKEGTLGIVTHSNPDPDAISSAMALMAIAQEASDRKLSARILYSGDIGHQENRAFVNLLDIKMERITEAVLKECNYLALVDASAPGVNNDLEKETPLIAIIDHHQNGGEKVGRADFVDVREEVGATATIMTEYLRELEIPISKKVATALYYGIRADTRDFRRGVMPSDLIHAAFLIPFTDAELMDKITSPALSQETMDILGSAIRNRKIRSGYLFSNVGYIRNRDALPQAAELMITLEGVNTAMVYGISETTIIISARNRDIRLHIGNVLHEAYGDIGDAGGHATMAAAAIPLNFFSTVKSKEDLLMLVQEALLRRFMKVVGLEKKEEEREIFEL